MSSLSDAHLARRAAPPVASEVATRAANTCGSIETGVDAPNPVADLELHSIALTPRVRSAPSRAPHVSPRNERLRSRALRSTPPSSGLRERPRSSRFPTIGEATVSDLPPSPFPGDAVPVSGFVAVLKDDPEVPERLRRKAGRKALEVLAVGTPRGSCRTYLVHDPEAEEGGWAMIWVDGRLVERITRVN